MPTSGLVLLQPVEDPIARREKRDRLELLTALIDAPGVEAFYHSDLIKLSPDHPAYGWACPVTDCEAPRGGYRDMCEFHVRDWWRAKEQGMKSWREFARTAASPRSESKLGEPPVCRVCPSRPSFNYRQRLCERHHELRRAELKRARPMQFDAWAAAQEPLPGYGRCAAAVCSRFACNPLGLCAAHERIYSAARRPGGARLPHSWHRRFEKPGHPVPVEIADKAAFFAWLSTVGPDTEPGEVNLRALPALVQAEVCWAMIAHARRPDSSHWPLLWIQEVADRAREQRVGSLYETEFQPVSRRCRLVVTGMRHELKLIYVSATESRELGYLDTEHFGVKYKHRLSAFDLTRVSQRWLRDLLWDDLAALLQCASPPRSQTPLEHRRRGCMELSAFLEATCPDGGHDPRLLTQDHMRRFVADMRHRAQNGLPSLAPGVTGPTPVVTDNSRRLAFNNVRLVLRKTLETGAAERIGLDREFITALPTGGNVHGRKRRPFSDDVARALADDANLQVLADTYDPRDHGYRDIWETIIATGRRCSEVLELRWDCIGRYGGVPMLWHDQTKVRTLDAAIRIPERVYEHLQQRQSKTLDRYQERHGGLPTPERRRDLALFPGVTRNPRSVNSISYTSFITQFTAWVAQLDLGRQVPHQARHTLATSLLRHGAGLHHVKQYLGHVSIRMAEHYAEVASSELDDILQHVWVAGPGATEPGKLLAAPAAGLGPEALRAMAVDLSRQSTPAEGGFCTFQPVVQGGACPWNLDCENCDKFVLSGADLLYWRRKREQWRSIAERAPDDATADYLHQVFEPTGRAIDGLEKALAEIGLLDQALAMDYRRPQDYFHRLWSTAFRATELTAANDDDLPEPTTIEDE